jgi:hypothetical protein
MCPHPKRSRHTLRGITLFARIIYNVVVSTPKVLVSQYDLVLVVLQNVFTVTKYFAIFFSVTVQECFIAYCRCRKVCNAI